MENYLNNNFDFNADELLELFDELPLWSAPFGLKLLEQVRLRKNMNVLDIGFGAGFPLTELAMRLGKSSTVYGIDPWEAAIKRAKKKIDFYKISNVKIIQGVTEKIPLPDNSIDLLTSNNGINNVADLAQSLSECARIAKPGCQFVQTMNLPETMIEFYEVLEKVLTDRKMEESLQKMKDQIHKKRKPLDGFLNLVAEKGFELNNLTHDQFNYHFVDGSSMLRHHSIRMAFMDGWKWIIPAEQQFEVFQIMEKMMNEIAAKNGSFQLSIPFVVIDSTKK